MCGWGVSGKYRVCVVSVCGKYHVWSVCVANIMYGRVVWQISGMCGRGVSGESDLEQMLFASQTSH